MSIWALLGAGANALHLTPFLAFPMSLFHVNMIETMAAFMFGTVLHSLLLLSFWHPLPSHFGFCVAYLGYWMYVNNNKLYESQVRFHSVTTFFVSFVGGLVLTGDTFYAALWALWLCFSMFTMYIQTTTRRWNQTNQKNHEQNVNQTGIYT
jgi:predicted membrane protein